MSRFSEEVAGKIAPFVKEGVAAQIAMHQAVYKIEEALAGDGSPERLRERIENGVYDWILNAACESETAEGFGPLDAKEMLEEIEELL